MAATNRDLAATVGALLGQGDVDPGEFRGHNTNFEGLVDVAGPDG